MAITKMNRFSLVCLREDKKNVLKELQKFGNSQFVNLQSETNKEENSLNFMNAELMDEEAKFIDNNLSMIRASISFLSTYVPKVSGLKAMRDGKAEVSYEDLQRLVDTCNWDDVCRELKSKESRINEINNEMTKIRNDKVLLEPWKSLDVSFNDLKNTKNIKTYIGTLNVTKESELEELKNSFKEISLSSVEIINQIGKDVYVVVFAHVSQLEQVEELLRTYSYSTVNMISTQKISDEIKSLNERLSSLEKEKEEIINELKKDERLETLERCEEYFSNAKERLECSKNFIGSKRTVVLSGWVPYELNQELEQVIKSSTEDNYMLQFKEVTEEEDLEVPVKLKNNKFADAFESITEMYSTPNYKGIDPTPWLAPFYFMFFGMMVADFGYGILLTLAAFLALKFFNLDEGTTKFARMFGYLGISTTLWGLIYGAGFGDFITFDSLLNQNTDIFTIMYMSIGFGVVQIILGLLIKAAMLIKAKKYFTAFAEVGLWFITFAGIAMMALGVSIGTWVMAIGMVGIVLTNGGDAQSVGGKLGNGAYALYGITGYVGDLISYTRLMALGIAGGSIAGAMNLIIGYLPGVAFFVVGPILFVLLHIFNLLLGLLGAYVHACRLQYVEYFGKFYEGGGEAFKPLKMRNKHVNVK